MFSEQKRNLGVADAHGRVAALFSLHSIIETYTYLSQILMGLCDQFSFSLIIFLYDRSRDRTLREKRVDG